MGWGPVEWVGMVLPEAKFEKKCTSFFEIFWFERPLLRYLLKSVLHWAALLHCLGLLAAVRHRLSMIQFNILTSPPARNRGVRPWERRVWSDRAGSRPRVAHLQRNIPQKNISIVKPYNLRPHKPLIHSLLRPDNDISSVLTRLELHTSIDRLESTDESRLEIIFDWSDESTRGLVSERSRVRW